MIKWLNEIRQVADLQPAEYNPRKAYEEQVDQLTKSLDRFNLAAPIIINKDNTVIGGHFRLKILKEQGATEVDVRVPDRQLTPEEEKELNLRLNKNLGEWDIDLLASIDEELLKEVGFDADWIDAVLKGITEDEPEQGEGAGFSISINTNNEADCVDLKFRLEQEGYKVKVRKKK